jgi:hypothetical protein
VRAGRAGAAARLALTWDDAPARRRVPAAHPRALRGGQPVKLLGRYSGSGPSKLVLTGETATGESFRQEVDVELPETSEQVPGLERLWRAAAHRLAAAAAGAGSP